MAEFMELDVPDSSLSVGSEPVFDIVCRPCSSDGTNVEAEVYCRDCHEHLCGQCIKHHKKFSSMRHHQLVDKAAMPGTQDKLKVRDVCTERCPDHQEEITKYFCPDHKALACGVCVTLGHKRCDGMEYIQDAAASLEDRQDYKDFTANLEGLKQKSKDTVTLALECKQTSLDCLTKVMQDLDVYRDKLVDAVDKNIQELRDGAGLIHAKDTERMDKLAAMGNQALTELQSVEIDFQRLLTKKHFCKVFIEMKRKEDAFTKLQENIEDMGGAEARVTTYTFQPDEKLQTLVGRQGGIGKLVTSSENKTSRESITMLRSIKQITATHVADINVKSYNNIETCDISGMAMISKGKVVVADNRNGTIKLINTENNTIISEITTKSCPWDVTICNDTVAATLPHASKIMFLQHDGGLVHDRDIDVDGICRGIDWYDDKLYVVFDEKKLEVMTMAGVVLQRFTTTDTGEQLFHEPDHVTVSADKCIYVSDYATGKLTVLNIADQQMGVYEDDELCSPKQLAVTKSGMMFLCDGSNEFKCNDTVHLLSPGCEIGKILLTCQDGWASPESVCYCEDTRRLYVGMDECDTMKVYQLS